MRLTTLGWLALLAVRGAYGQAAAGQSLTLTLQDALARARTYSQDVYSSQLAARIAHEDTLQAKTALLPTVNWVNQFAYTQPNGTPSGVFISNDGPHVYNNQAVVHADLFAPEKRAEMRRAAAAEALARAKSEIALRGLTAVVAQNYYAVLSAQRDLTNATQSLQEAQQFLDLTRKQEAGGEVSHADSVKAELLTEQRRRDTQNAQLALDKARIGFAVLLFPDYGQPYSLVDDLENQIAIPPFTEIQAMASRNSPETRAAQAAVQQQTSEISLARAAMLPTLSFDYYYGINANQYAVWDRDHLRNLGSAASAQLNIPVWNWGATRSKVRQAELRLQQARNDLSLTQRQLLSSLNAFYLEADAASLQSASLRHSVDLAEESLRLALLRYQAGEATALEVSDAQTSATEARSAFTTGLVRRRVAVATLQTLTGAF
jgi:outer membrane protein TolC